jgi:hypothetical protein
VSNPLHCNGLGCPSADLINAHFIPQAFARQIKKSSGGSNTTASELRFTRGLQHGLYDNAILCADCDGFLGREYDNPAFKLISSLSVTAFSAPTFEIPNVDCDLLCAFILAVLWRCSVATVMSYRTSISSAIRTQRAWRCGAQCPCAIFSLSGIVPAVLFVSGCGGALYPTDTSKVST